MIVPVFVPRLRAAGSEVTVKVTPSGPRVPEEGETVSQGLSVRAVNESGGVCPATKTCCTIPAWVPISTVVCRCAETAGITTALTTFGLIRISRARNEAVIARRVAETTRQEIEDLIGLDEHYEIEAQTVEKHP